MDRRVARPDRDSVRALLRPADTRGRLKSFHLRVQEFLIALCARSSCC
jgi:hypothetical protein